MANHEMASKPGKPDSAMDGSSGMFGERIRDSYVHMNNKPGFGIEIDWDYAKQHAA